MNGQTERRAILGPAGALEVAIDRPAGPACGVAVMCHPHPLFAGTMDNKVVQTLARAHLAAGWTCWRFNVRGVGGSVGTWDEGRGEREDAWAVLQAARAEAASAPAEPVAIAGFSFGGFIASHLAAQAREAGLAVSSTVLVAPSVVKFEAAPIAAGSLVLQGGADDVVPTDAVLAWAEPQVQPVVVVPGVGHFFHGQLPLLKQIVLRHLQTLP
jgi:hypothetical protein